MRGKFFMQLILALAVLMMLGGKGGAPRPELSGNDMLEVLEYVSGGNGEMDKLIKEVRQVSEIISAFAPVTAAFGAGGASFDENGSKSSDNGNKISDCGGTSSDIGLSLQPIANIADDSIYNALSKAIG